MSGQQGEPAVPGSAREQKHEPVGTLTRLSDGREFPVGFGCLRIGRQRRSDLKLSERSVSRHHADICHDSGRYVLYDHTKDATWVNGSLIGTARTLENGDTVKIGAVEFRFELKSAVREGGGGADPTGGA